MCMGILALLSATLAVWNVQLYYELTCVRRDVDMLLRSARFQTPQTKSDKTEYTEETDFDKFQPQEVGLLRVSNKYHKDPAQ